jgi:hypothetical protein
MDQAFSRHGEEEEGVWDFGGKARMRKISRKT